MIVHAEVSTISKCIVCFTSDTVVISGEDVCCSVVFSTLAAVSELLMTSVISCPLWSTVYECQRVESAVTSPMRTECGMCVMCCV